MWRTLALLALVALSVSAGCLNHPFISGGTDASELSGSETYEDMWGTDADAMLVAERGQYRAVYRVNESDRVFEVYQRDSLGTERPLPISSLKYRYPNGTVVNASALSVTETRDRLKIHLPQQHGKVAFVAPREGKRIDTQRFVTGSYVVVLPPKARVGVPLLAQVRPRGYNTTMVDDRVRIRWSEVTEREQAIVVRYYLERDLTIFGGLVAVVVVVGIVGMAYYLWQIRQLVKQREAVGLDVDTGDDEFG